MKKYIIFGIIKIGYIFVKFFGIGLGLDCFWSVSNLKSQNFLVSILVSEKLSGLGFGLDVFGLDFGLDVFGLDYIT